MTIISAIKNFTENIGADPFSRIDLWKNLDALISQVANLKRIDISATELGLDEIF